MNRHKVVTPLTVGLALCLMVLSLASWANNYLIQSNAKAATAKHDWLQFGFGQDKTANNTLETTINASNVANLQPLFKVALNDAPDGAPVLLADVSTPGGVKDLIFIMGERGRLSAFDAHSGAQVWSKTFSGGGISNSAPAIDPNRQFVYANAPDGRVHKVKVGDGTEITGGGWPQQAGPGKSSSQLAIVTARSGRSYLWAANEGHGHYTVIDLGTGSQRVFNLACANRPNIHFGAAGEPNDCTISGANPWSRPGAVYDAALDRVFVTTGTNNGRNWKPGFEWRQSYLAIPPDGSTQLINGGGYPIDSYTPTDWQATVDADRDIGSANIILLPVGISSKFPHLGVSGGKDRRVRLLNVADLSGKGGPGHTGGELQLLDFSQMSMMRSEGAAWTNPQDGKVWVFIPGEMGIAGFQVVVDGAGNPSLQLRWTRFNGWTTSAIVANGVLYAATGGGEHTPTQTIHQVRALNPTTGAVLWTGGIGEFHWASPIVANGIVYMVDGNSGGFGTGTTGNLIAWQLKDGPPPPSDGTPHGGTAWAVPGTVQAEDYNDGGQGVAFNDTDTTNNGGAYRPSESVDIQATTDSGGGFNVGWTRATEWLKYTVNAGTAGGTFTFKARVASAAAGAKFHAEIDGVNVTGALSVPNTGGNQTWTTVSKTGINLSPGQHILRIVFDTAVTGGTAVGNFNFFSFSSEGTTVTPTPDGTPFGATPWAVPGTIQAENFNNGGEGVAYHDTDATNNGGQYRTNESVDIQAATDTGGGFNVGWTRAGEWLKYSINVPAGGTFTFNARVASAAAGAKFHVEIDSVDVTGALSVPNTGGNQTWTTLSKTGINLTSGQHILRIVFDTAVTGGTSVGNYNFFSFS